MIEWSMQLFLCHLNLISLIFVRLFMFDFFISYDLKLVKGHVALPRESRICHMLYLVITVKHKMFGCIYFCEFRELVKFTY